MSTTITNNTGSGKIKDDSLISFSYSEDATPIDPMSSAGSISQVSFSGVEETSNWNGSTHDNSKLMINNSITVSDSVFGSVNMDVKKIATNAGGVVSITGDSLLSKLNVEKTAQPFHGNLADAIIYYCGLCGVTPTFTTYLSQFEAIEVDYVGWRGNVWDHIKMLCAVTSLSTTSRVQFEAYFTGTALGFRPVGAVAFDIEPTITDFGQSINSFEAALSVSLYNYNTSFISNDIIYSESNYSDSIDPRRKFLSSILENMSVAPGKTLVKRFIMDTSLFTISQPDCVSTIEPFPYSAKSVATLFSGSYSYTGGVTGFVDVSVDDASFMVVGEAVTLSTTSFTSFMSVLNNATLPIGEIIGNTIRIYIYLGTTSTSQAASGNAVVTRNGQYVIVGNDNLPVKPSQWLDLGGSLTVALTGNPNEIEITIVAPEDKSIVTADDSNKYTYGPYRIGVETSGDGVDYPALFLVGNGVKYNRVETEFLTGSDADITSKDKAKIIDNPFITNDFTMANAGLAAAQSACSPVMEMNGSSVPSGFSFGSTIGATFVKNNAKMRLSSLSYDVDSVNWSASKYTTFADFDTQNTGKTFANFDAVTGGSQPISFNEFSIVPLIES